MNHISGAAHDEMTGAAGISGSLHALNTEALSFVPRDKAETLARQWLSGVPWIVHDGHWTIARLLALEVALITSSLTGSTAFDRLARGMKGRSADDLAALALLRRSWPRLARLTGRRFEDLATFETRSLLPSPGSAAAGDGIVFGRFAVTGDGSAIATGTLVQLDHDALAVVQPFLRPNGRGLGNPVRCAEVLYGTWFVPACRPRTGENPNRNCPSIRIATHSMRSPPSGRRSMANLDQTK
jgi:hypothetical protein